MCLIAKNVEAGGAGGFHLLRPGNGTSWPPHEHSKMLEEVVYFDLPEPAYGLHHLVTTIRISRSWYPTVARRDAVLMPQWLSS